MTDISIPPNPNRRQPMFRLLAVLLIVILLLGTAFIVRIVQLNQNTTPPAGTPSGELALISDRDGSWDVFLLDSTGTFTNLTPEGAEDDDYFVSWDFSSERLNFIADRSSELGPVQMQPDGSGLRVLGIADAVVTLFFEGRIDWDPNWTSDGKRLVWSSLRDFNLEIYTADNVDDATPTRITDTPARDWYPSWSPDGTQIAFTSDRAGNEDIYLVNADGTNLRQLTTQTRDDIHPAWTLDGKNIMFVSEREVELKTGKLLDALYVVPVDGAESTVHKLRADEILDCDPIYSADGKVMVFSSNRSGTWQLYQQNTDGTGLKQLTNGQANSLFPVWRPVVKTTS